MDVEDGLTRSAVLLMSLGEEAAAQVFRHLTPKEVQKIGETMAKLRTVNAQMVTTVLARFKDEAADQTSIVADTDGYVKAVLRRALGEDKAGLLIDRIMQGGDVAGIESLKWMDPSAVAELIRNEHPQIIASIVVHLERDHASAILGHLNERTRNEVLLRVATLDGIQPHALRELNEVLAKVLAGSDKLKRAALGGIKTAAEILNFMGSSAETGVLDSIREQDEELATKISDQMFTFDDLIRIEDRALQLMMREVQSDKLVIAMKGADPDLREKIFKNMSSRAAETLREDLDAKGPVRISEVETEQKEILKILRRLADEGQITLSKGNDDSFV